MTKINSLHDLLTVYLTDKGVPNPQGLPPGLTFDKSNGKVFTDVDRLSASGELSEEVLKSAERLAAEIRGIGAEYGVDVASLKDVRDSAGLDGNSGITNAELGAYLLSLSSTNNPTGNILRSEFPVHAPNDITSAIESHEARVIFSNNYPDQSVSQGTPAFEGPVRCVPEPSDPCKP